MLGFNALYISKYDFLVNFTDGVKRVTIKTENELSTNNNDNFYYHKFLYGHGGKLKKRETFKRKNLTDLFFRFAAFYFYNYNFRKHSYFKLIHQALKYPYLKMKSRKFST